MTGPGTLPEDADALHVEDATVEDVVAALSGTCARDGLVRAAPEALDAFGLIFPGEEMSGQARFLVAPPQGRWTTVLMSRPDWDHDWLPGLLARLGKRAAYLMLHDGDVATLHLYLGERMRASLVTAPAHFDMPESPPDPLLRAALSDFAGRVLSDAEVDAACFPPGPFGVDGRLAFARLSGLLGLPAHGAASYASVLGPEGRFPAQSHAGWTHACFTMQENLAAGADAEDEVSGEDEPGRLLPFRPRRA